MRSANFRSALPSICRTRLRLMPIFAATSSCDIIGVMCRNIAVASLFAASRFFRDRFRSVSFWDMILGYSHLHPEDWQGRKLAC